MCRVIGFVSVDNFYEKSKVVFQISKHLSNEGNRVCLFDSYFGMNKLSVFAGENKGVDLKEYITGRFGTLSVLNKINSNLFYVKTNNLSFDYNSHINLIQFFISEISERFDFILKKVEPKFSKNGVEVDLTTMILNTIGNNKGYSDNNAVINLKGNINL